MNTLGLKVARASMRHPHLTICIALCAATLMGASAAALHI